jgi:hypothetical protein
MGNDPQNTVLPLGNASVALQPGCERRRFRVAAAILAPRGRRRVRLTFEGPQGSVTIELPRVAFWRLTALFHERSIAAADLGPKPPEPQKRRRLS